jgi:hypothetical protein
LSIRGLSLEGPSSAGLQINFEKKNVSETNQPPQEERNDSNEIYDPEEFAESIVDDTPPDEVAWYYWRFKKGLWIRTGGRRARKLDTARALYHMARD